MPIVNETSDLFADPTSGDTPDPARARGRAICAAGTVENAADDLNGSTYHLCDLPADAILDSRTAFHVENTGFAAIRIGTLDDEEALVAQTKATEDVVQPIAFGDANHGKPVWEVLGLEAAPESGVVSLYQHAIANATGAGSLKFEVHYRFR